MDSGPDGADITLASALPKRKHPSRNSLLIKNFRSNILFVTVCTKDREPLFLDLQYGLCLKAIWESATKWLIGHYVIMPDHVHFLCAPNSCDCDFQKWMTYWKSMFARNLKCPVWQRDCWDTQIRDIAHYRERIEYIRTNPVRKGLVATPEEWSGQGVLNELVWHD